MSHAEQLVSVVVPAYNAQATLDETLASVRAQKHRALEIIIVDDGSTDGTRAIAERHAAEDARVRVLHQANAGVAAARNAGWQQARSEFIAFIDADDLWAPTKIERQLAALLARGPRCGLAWCWTMTIDAAGAVTHAYHSTVFGGRVLDELLLSNFVGSGSGALLRRQALIEAGGFDSSLHAADAQGCEDWLLYVHVAAAWEYAAVPEYLVGYRQLPDNMSSDRPRMMRSHMLMCDQVIARYPGSAAAARRGLRDYAWALMTTVRQRQGLAASTRMWRQLWRAHPRVAARIVLLDIPLEPLRRVRAAWRRRRGGGGAATAASAIGRPFLSPTSRT